MLKMRQKFIKMILELDEVVFFAVFILTIPLWLPALLVTKLVEKRQKETYAKLIPINFLNVLIIFQF